MRVLVIEDDSTILNHVDLALRDEGFAVDLCSDGVDGFRHATEHAYDAAVVDLMLPKLDGLSLIERLRERNCTTPVLILSAKQSVDDRIAGLRAGGDDYLVKPFALAELVARVQALIRRSSSHVELTTLSYADVEMDLLARVATRAKKRLDLRPREFALLEYMMRNAETVLAKAMILEHIWNYQFDPQTNIVDVLVCHLRTKVEEGESKKLIHTIRGAGYVLRESQSTK